jgi:hypothetical protein
MDYKTEMKKFRTFDISNKRIFLMNFFDDIRFKLDCVFLSSSFKPKKEHSDSINKCHNKLAETVNIFEDKCYKELGSLDGREIIYFKKYHLLVRNVVVRMSTTCDLYKVDVRKECDELQIESGYGGFNDDYLKEIWKYAYILDYAIDLLYV